MPAPFTCQDGEPLLKLESGGVAPVLNYSLPQDTSFTTYGTMNLNIPLDHFLLEASDVPTLPDVVRPDGTTTPQRSPTDFIIKMDGTYNREVWQGADIFDSPTLLAQLQAQVTTGRIRKAKDLGLISSEVSGTGVAVKDLVGDDLEIPTEVVTWDTVLKSYLQGYDTTELANKVNQGYSIQVVNRTGGGKRIVLTPRPNTGGATPTFTATPTLYIVEEYVTRSYARDYGAGKTLQIHSLFPGEKTTMTIKTFKEIKTLQSRAENVIDSFSQESADELENQLEAEASSQETRSTQFGVQGSAGVSFGPFNASVSSNYSVNASRNSNTRNLSKALSKSVDKSNSSRQININTSTQENSTESEEVATVRQFENVNKSKVLNLAFRELLQEYVTLLFLNDIKIGFCNGHGEMTRVVSLEDIDILLEAYIIGTERAKIKATIKAMYANMFNEWANDLNPIGTVGKDLIDQKLPYLTKNKTVKSTYKHKATDTVPYAVEGILLNVKNYTLRTPAVVVDAFLGHGDALDCYAMKLMEADLEKTRLENEKRLKDMENETLKLQNEAIRLANEEADREFKRKQEDSKMNLIREVINEMKEPVQKAEWLAKLLNPAPKEIVTNTLERIENNRG